MKEKICDRALETEIIASILPDARRHGIVQDPGGRTCARTLRSTPRLNPNAAVPEPRKHTVCCMAVPKRALHRY